MTSKEKAEELVLKYLRLQENGSTNWFHKRLAKQCALIAVDEILNLMIKTFKWDINYNGNIDYWKEVKIEIDKL